MKYLSWRKILASLALCLLLPAVSVLAQEEAAPNKDFWFCPSAEAAWLGPPNIAFGGGFALGYGRGVSIGLKTTYLFPYINNEGEEISVLELCFLFRYYFKHGSCSGLFIQFSGGPALFQDKLAIHSASHFGNVSANLNLGWRFLLGKHWFIEPSLHTGILVYAGVNFSAGIRL